MLSAKRIVHIVNWKWKSQWELPNWQGGPTVKALRIRVSYIGAKWHPELPELTVSTGETKYGTSGHFGAIAI